MVFWLNSTQSNGYTMRLKENKIRYPIAVFLLLKATIRFVWSIQFDLESQRTAFLLVYWRRKKIVSAYNYCSRLTMPSDCIGTNRICTVENIRWKYNYERLLIVKYTFGVRHVLILKRNKNRNCMIFRTYCTHNNKYV